MVLHNTRLGLQQPQATIHNVFGDSYAHALCPAHPDAVRIHGVRLMGGLEPSMDIVMNAAYGEPLERVATGIRETRAGLRPGQELTGVLRMGFYGGAGLGSPILTASRMTDLVRAVADAGADGVGFYNYAEAPQRCVDWIGPALQAVGVAARDPQPEE